MSENDVTPPGSGNAAVGDLSCVTPERAAALAALAGVLDVLTGVDVSVLDGPEAAVIVRRITQATSRLTAVATRMLPVVEADGMWAAGGARSFAGWVAAEHHLPRMAAHAQVRFGRALRDHLPLTAAAAAAGDITVEAARVLTQLTPTTDQRRQLLADPDYACNEAFLVEQAQEMSVDDLRVLARRWAAYSDPDADDRGYVEAYERQHLQLARLGDMYDVSGQLTIESGQALKAALAACTPPRAADDHRSAGQRRAQALSDMARIALDATEGGKGRTVRPRINVLVDYPTFSGLLTSARARGTQGELDTDGPTRGPAFATPDILTGAAVAGGPQYEDGTPICRAALELVACDSGIARFIFGTKSEVLDVGREQRSFTGPRRAALIARDKHCRYPGCTAPPILCDGHHIDEWARDHGRTDVRRGVLLCTFHHGLVHRHHIDITLRGRHVTFTDRHGHEITGDHHRLIHARQ